MTTTKERNPVEVAKALTALLTELEKHAARLGFEPNYSGTREEYAGRIASGRVSFGGLSLRGRIPIWACECDIDIRTEKDEHPRSTYGVIATAEIGWGSTHRSIAMATATAALYQRAIELAAIYEAALNR